MGINDVRLGRAGRTKGEIAALRFVVDGLKLYVVVGEELMVGSEVVVEVYAEDHDLGHLLLQSIQ